MAETETKRSSAVEIFIALLTLPLLFNIWFLHRVLQILSANSAPNPVAVEKFAEVQTALESGEIKVEPPDRAKSITAIVRYTNSRMQDQGSELRYDIEMIEMLFRVTAIIFAAQFVVAISGPVGRLLRKRRKGAA